MKGPGEQRESQPHCLTGEHSGRGGDRQGPEERGLRFGGGHVCTRVYLCQWWECLRGMCVFMCERMESMCKAHGCGKLGSLKTHSSFRWVLQAGEKVALLLAQGHTPATECSRHDRGQQHLGWEPEPFHARIHAFDVRTQVLSPEGLSLAWARGSWGEGCGAGLPSLG